MKQLQRGVRADVLRKVLSLIARRGEVAPRAQPRRCGGTLRPHCQRASDLRHARAWIRTASVALITALTLVFFSCSGDEPGGEQVGRISQALPSSANAGVLGFEDHTQWSGASQNSTEHSEGQLSAVVPVNGWTEVTSIPLDSLGEVDDELTVDLQLPAEVGWGEARVIVVLPSQNEHYRELGSEQLGGLAAGEFHRLSFAIPADLAIKLAASYNDLTFRVVINAPPGDYLLDRLWLWDESPDEQGGGEAGAGGAPPVDE